MNVTLKYALRQARYWRGVVRKLREEQRALKAPDAFATIKEREKTAPAACARKRFSISQPTLAEVLKFAAGQKIDAAFAQSWFKQIDENYRWRHPKTGRRIRMWPRYLELWWERRDEFDPLPVATESKRITINTKGLDAL